MIPDVAENEVLRKPVVRVAAKWMCMENIIVHFFFLLVTLWTVKAWNRTNRIVLRPHFSFIIFYLVGLKKGFNTLNTSMQYMHVTLNFWISYILTLESLVFRCLNLSDSLSEKSFKNWPKNQVSTFWVNFLGHVSEGQRHKKSIITNVFDWCLYILM